MSATNSNAAMAETTKPDVVEMPFVRIAFQRGSVTQVGLNGVRVEDVIEIVAEKLRQYQYAELPCLENEQALHHLNQAKQALLERRRLRQDQGVINSKEAHVSMFEHRTEDEDHDFSATGG
jgi:hypothetical protein